MCSGSDWISCSASRSDRSGANGRRRRREVSIGATSIAAKGTHARPRPGYGDAVPTSSETIEVEGRDVRVTNPAKVYFPDAVGGPITKLELVRYWVEVAEGALAGCRDRP